VVSSLSLIHKNLNVTVTDAANELGITHPHVSQLAKKLIAAKLISFRTNPKDRRSRIIALTAKGKAMVDDLEPLWSTISEAVSD